MDVGGRNVGHESRLTEIKQVGGRREGGKGSALLCVTRSQPTEAPEMRRYQSVWGGLIVSTGSTAPRTFCLRGSRK